MSAKNPQKKRKSASDIEEKTTAFNMSSNMTEIFPGKFKDDNFLDSVVMNKSVQKIGKYAFANCKQLKKWK